MKKENKNKFRTASVIMCAVMILALAGCGSEPEISVEDQVAQALSEERNVEVIPPADETADTDAAGASVDGSAGTSGTMTTAAGKPVSSSADKTGDNALDTSGAVSDTGAKSVNPFLGDTSTATSFNIKFNIETDSGLAGITWGSTDGRDGEYYLFAFDCTRDIPRLYTCRRQGDDIYDEVYTNLDFMFPEMVMFTSVEHIVEIKVSGMTATTYLDSYKVCDTSLDSLKSAGQIGMWVMKGNYHEYIDNLFVAEGTEGDGEWIYSDDFAKRNNLFSPELKTVSGRLYVTAGYHVAPSKEQ